MNEEQFIKWLKKNTYSFTLIEAPEGFSYKYMSCEGEELESDKWFDTPIDVLKHFFSNLSCSRLVD